MSAARNMTDAFLRWVSAQVRRYRLRSVRAFARLHEGISKSAVLGADVVIIAPPGTVTIGDLSYVNEAIISASREGRVWIGRRCAIGYRVSIKAVTHDLSDPCPDEEGKVKTVAADIRIGDCCWIGDNVFIREGVELGNNVIVAANSVVTRSFPANVILGGAPARILRRSNHA